jgi:hypothetical protein
MPVYVHVTVHADHIGVIVIIELVGNRVDEKEEGKGNFKLVVGSANAADLQAGSIFGNPFTFAHSTKSYVSVVRT